MGLKMNTGTVKSQLSEMNQNLDTMVTRTNLLQAKISMFTETQALLVADAYDSIREYYASVHLPLLRGLICYAEELKEANENYSRQIDSWLDADYVDEDGLQEDLETIIRCRDQLNNIEEWGPATYALDHTLEQMQWKIEEKLERIEMFLSATAGIYAGVDNQVLDQGISCIESVGYDSNLGIFKLSGIDMDWSKKINDRWNLDKNEDRYELEVKEGDNDEILKWLKENGMQEGFSVTGATLDNLDGYKMLKDGIWFTFHKKNGKFFVELSGSSITGTNKMTWGNIQKYLNDNIKDINWTKYDVKTLTKEGIEVGSQKGNKYFTDIENTLGERVGIGDAYKEILSKGRLGYAGEQFITSFKRAINPLDNFRGWKEVKLAGKAAKSLGIAGDALTVGNNFINNFIEDEKLVVSADRVQDFTTDTIVDVGTSAGVTAGATAIGTAICPGVGTAVGAVAGVVIDVGINWEVADWDSDGKKDSIVDGIKMGVDNVCDAVGDWISDTFW